MKRLPFALGVAFALLQLPCSAAPAAAPAPANAESDTLTGKVLETMNAATYTYVLVESGGKKIWAAAPQFEVKVGDTVAIAEAMPMSNYHSKTLNRTFDVVYFSGNVRVNGNRAAGTPSATSSTALSAIVGSDLPKGHPTPAAAGAPAPNLSNIKRAANGQTVAEIHAGKAKLTGQPIAVRGRVVKYNGNIMGKNWLHVRDGSGSEGTNDLTVTTDAVVKVGDLVVVTGTLAADRDFGAGYKYGLIVENAKVAVE